MDGAGTSDLYPASVAEWAVANQAAGSRRGAVVSLEAWGVSLGGAATGADLGGSSKYSNENFED